MLNVNSLIVVSDLHIMCQLGLCPPGPVQMDEGGWYTPSVLQQKVYAYWHYFWHDWVPQVTRGDDYAVVVNGDVLDYRHHNSVHQWTHNLAVGKKVAFQVLQEIENLPHCIALYMIRGTEAHSGPSGEEEESLAYDLKAVPNKWGQFARHDLWKYVGGERMLVHFAHHIGTTSSSSYESTAVYKELDRAYVEAGRWGNRPPDVVVRSHRHRFLKTEIATVNERGVSLVTPGWQGKTPFVYRLGNKLSEPQFGGVLIRLSEEGEPYVRQWVKCLERPEAE